MIPLGHRRFQIEDLQRIAAKVFIHGLQLGEGQLVQRLAGFFRQSHHRADGVVRRPEGQALAHEIIRQVGREQGRVARGGGAGGAVDLRVRQHCRHEPRRGPHGVGGVEQPLLVLLQIPVIGHRQPFEQREQRHQVPENPAGFAARELGDIRVFLLGHERGAGGVGVGDPDEMKFRAGPEDDVLGKPGEVRGEQRAGGAEFDGKIPVAHRVHGILRELDPAVDIEESQLARHEFAVERQGAAGDGPAAERADINARAAVP